MDEKERTKEDAENKRIVFEFMMLVVDFVSGHLCLFFWGTVLLVRFMAFILLQPLTTEKLNGIACFDGVALLIVILYFFWPDKKSRK